MFYVFSYGIWIELLGINNPYRYMIYLLVVLVAMLMLFKTFVIKSKKYSTVAVLFAVGWIYFFTMFFINGSGSIINLYNYFFIGLVTFAGLFIFRSTDNIQSEIYFKYFLKLIFLFGVINAALSIYETVTNTVILSSGSIHYISTFNSLRVRANGLIGSSLINGCLCGISMLTFISVYHETKRKIITIICASLCGLALILTMSRGPFVATISSIIIFFLLKQRKCNTGNRLIRVLILFIALIASVEIFINIDSSNAVIVRMQSILNWSSEGGNLVRLGIWTNALKMMSGHYLFGMGIGSLDTYSIAVTESGLVYVFFETGIVGCFFYFTPIIYIIAEAIKENKKRMNNQVITCVSILTLILIENIVLQVMTSLIIQIIFGIALANIVTAGAGSIKSSLEKDAVDKIQKRWHSHSKGIRSK
jgi:hypothetical protein